MAREDTPVEEQVPCQATGGPAANGRHTDARSAVRSSSTLPNRANTRGATLSTDVVTTCNSIGDASADS